MSALGDMIRRMGEAGASVEVIAIAAEALEANAAPEPSKAALRTRRWREAKASQTVTERHAVTPSDDGDAPPSPCPETKVPPTPPSKTQPQSLAPTPPISPAPLGKPSSKLSDFERFWAVWPNKVAKRAGELAFPAARKRALSVEAIIAGVEAAKRHSRKWREGFVPNPATWLNADGWLDDHGEPKLVVAPDPQPPSPTVIAGRFEHYRDTGEWRDNWGERPSLDRQSA